MPRSKDGQRLALTVFGRFLVFSPLLIAAGVFLYFQLADIMASLKLGQLGGGQASFVPVIAIAMFGVIVGTAIYRLLPRKMPWFLPTTKPPWYA